MELYRKALNDVTEILKINLNNDRILLLKASRDSIAPYSS